MNISLHDGDLFRSIFMLFYRQAILLPKYICGFVVFLIFEQVGINGRGENLKVAHISDVHRWMSIGSIIISY